MSTEDPTEPTGEDDRRFSSETTRRGALAAVIAAGIGGLSLSGARELLDAFAPLSGRSWRATDRTISEEVSNPYGDATITRDEWGVPHVEAEDELAGYYALGYVQGFDRGAQMDLIRRLMRGEIAEVAGEELADDDEFHRRMNFAAAAEAAVDAYEGTHIEEIGDAFAAGVNDAFENEQLQLEFEVLGYEPDEWTLADSLIMEKQISWGLTGQFTQLRLAEVQEALADVVGEEDADTIIQHLYPMELDHDWPIVREGHDDGAGGVSLSVSSVGDPHGEIGPELVSWLGEHETGPHVGSNSWLAHGDRGENGLPVMANDTHLPLLAPPVWYEQHLSLPDYQVRGLTFPGVPFIVIGRNEDGAWGFTNSGADVVDCYTYEIDDDNDQYRYGDEWVDLRTEEDTIAIDGADDREIVRKYTRHGPLLEEHGQRVAVSWTGFAATRTVEAIYEINRSEDVADIESAVEKFDLPTQCLTYVSRNPDEDDRTTYFRVTGQVPLREADQDGQHPALTIFDGSAGEGEWEGFEPYAEVDWEEFCIPYDEMIHVDNPDYLATANQRVADDPEHYLGVAYAEHYRGSRIYELMDEHLEGGGTMSLEDHMDLQMDTLDKRAPDVLPDLQSAVEEADVSDDVAEAAATLEEWDHYMDRDSEGALVFARFFDHFRRRVIDPAFDDAGIEIGLFLRRDWVFIENVPADSPLYAEESREETLVAALEDAVEEIDDEGWETYGDWNHTGEIIHPFGEEAPWFNYPEYPTDGSRMTVNNFNVADVFGEASGSAFRMVAEPGGEAYITVPGGNSGDYFSEHYDDQLEDFTNGNFRPMALEVEGDTIVTMEGDS